MNRRGFLLGASALAVTTVTPALAKPIGFAPASTATQTPGGSTTPATGFFGNPNVPISSISTTGGIVTSRDGDTSFQTPFFIQASASAIAAIGTSAPYEDLSYSWDFGDPNGKELFVRPTDGLSVNANTDQRGPEAAYCYRTAGTYTITLTIAGKSGTNYISSTVTKRIIVTAFSPTGSLYVDQVNGNDGNLGSSPNSPKKSIAAINAAIGSNRAIYLARGSRWSGSSGIDFRAAAVNGCRISAYGSGANPIVEVTGGNTVLPLIIANGGSSSPTPQSDIVISNVDLIQSGSANAGALMVASGGNSSAKIRNIYFDNCNITMTIDTNTTPMAVANLGGPIEIDLTSNFGFWKTSFTNPITTKTITMAILGSSLNWFFVLGGAFSGAGTSATYDHHIYPDTRNHSLYAWINFAETGVGQGQRSFCINTNWDGPTWGSGVNQIAQYHCFSENMMANTLFAFDLGNRSNNTNAADSTVQFQYVVAQSNGMKNLNGTSTLLFGCGLSVTMRDNRIWQCLGSSWYGPVGSGQVASVAQLSNLITRIYRNRIYWPASAPAGALIGFPESGWKQPQQITDNVIHDARTVGKFIRLIDSDPIGSSIIDRNTYYAPSVSGWPTNATSWLDNTVGKSFGQWKSLSFDASGTQTNPGWKAPVAQWSDMN